ncbi:MAG: DUF2059 domain-containing protein [Acidobacteria bacterium]|nr:DUF2059 domain-containing protein [Acidobacteriota bacterium]
MFFEKFRQNRDPRHLTDFIVPIYDKHYTAAEIKQLIELYQTRLGGKMITVLPKVMAESQAAGGELGPPRARAAIDDGGPGGRPRIEPGA